MPAYDKPIQFIPGPARPAKQVAAVIVFEDPSDIARIQAFLDRLAERKIIKEGAEAKEYDANMTSAELYFP